MVKVTPSIRSTVISQYVLGSVFDEIVNETGLSKGTIFNIVREWREKISRADLDEIKSFTTRVKKSGITIQQCVEGFRIAQVLKEFGIREEFDQENIENGQEENNTKDNLQEIGLEEKNDDDDYGYGYGYEFSEYTSIQEGGLGKSYKKREGGIKYFLDNMYAICKKKGIHPPYLIKWIEDMLEINSYINSETDSENSNDGEGEEGEIKGEYKIKTTYEDLPLLSTISFFIDKKKKEVKALHDIKKIIKNDIDEANKHKRRIETHLREYIKKEKVIMTYFRWYRDLKQELWDIHGLEIDEEIEMFSKAISDFKNYDYDASTILKEYKENESLRQEKIMLQGIIELNVPLKKDLETQIALLNSEIAQSSQLLNVYKELEKIGFGLKELKRLYNTVIEIARANDIDDDNEAVGKFLKDVEEQYDDKLGFEVKVKEIKAEMKKLESEVPEYKFHLQLQAALGPTLNHLHSNGVTNEDIISVNQLVSSLIYNNYLSDIAIQNNKTNRNDYWRLYMGKLKDLAETINEIEKHASQLNNIKTEIGILSIKRQEIEKQCLEANHNLSSILSQAIYLTDITRRINDRLGRRIMYGSKFLLILVIVNLAGGDDESNGSK